MSSAEGNGMVPSSRASRLHKQLKGDLDALPVRQADATCTTTPTKEIVTVHELDENTHSSESIHFLKGSKDTDKLRVPEGLLYARSSTKGGYFLTKH